MINIYKCTFDFSTMEPKSHVVGKTGELEISINKELSEAEINQMKTAEWFISDIAQHLITVHKQRNIILVTVKDITPLEVSKSKNKIKI